MFSMPTNKELGKSAKELLIARFNSIAKIENTAITELKKLLVFETYKKNTLVIKENELVEHLYFIFSGVVRIYYYKDDKLIIERFEKEGGFFGGNYDHLSKYPGVHNYETLENLTVIKIKHSDFEKLFIKYHSLERLYRKLLEVFHFSYVDRLYALKAASSEERYLDFVKEYGDIMNRISLKNVANYLGMTSETVSRIRSKKLNS